MAADDRSSEALLTAYATTRDEAALAALVERHWAHAWRIALRSLGDPAAAEDAAQEAMVALARSAARFAPGAAFLPWFRTLVVNAARMSGRGRGRRALHEAAATRAQAGAARDDAGERRVAAAELEHRISSLPHEYREPIVLHYFESLTHDEVAAALGCPRGTVATRLRRGVERLREAMGAAVALAAVTAALEAAAAAPASAAEAPPAPMSAILRRAHAAKQATFAAKLVAGFAAVAACAGLAWMLVGGNLPPAPSAPPAIAVAAAPRSAARPTKPPLAPAPRPATGAAAGPLSAVPSPEVAPPVPAPASPTAAPAPEKLAEPATAPVLLEGRVVSSIGKRPLVGLTVQLVLEPGKGSPADMKERDLNTTTDAGGFFSFSLVPGVTRDGATFRDETGRAYGDSFLMVTGAELQVKGFEEPLPRGVLHEQLARGIPLELEATTKAVDLEEVVLPGRVLDAVSRRPIPGAEVLLEFGREDERCRLQEESAVDGAFEFRGFVAGAGVAITRGSDPRPLTHLAVHVRAEGYASFKLEVAPALVHAGGPVAVDLQPGGTELRVKVVERATGAPFAKLWFMAWPESAEHLFFRVPSDAQGVLRVFGLPAGQRLEVRAILRDGRRVSFEAVVPDATPEIPVVVEVEPRTAE